ncbi:MAG: nucleoside monophosphate kinase [Vampirovibrionales bacterium]|nr:nucleoside monophosphate kinase [Vampirovibrionales bacterium]
MKADHLELRGKRFFPFIAPPNGGKGTQTHALLKAFPKLLERIDMGALLREAVTDPANPLGPRIRERLKQGSLVDSDIVMQTLQGELHRIVKRNPKVMGYILDGFPRNAEQVERLESVCEREGAEIARAFYLNVPDSIIVERAAGRVFCLYCKQSFNLRIEGMKSHYCPVVSRSVTESDTHDYFQRDDDHEDVIKSRLQLFHDDTAPIIACFREKGLLEEINGDRPVQTITEDILSRMNISLKNLKIHAAKAETDHPPFPAP